MVLRIVGASERSVSCSCSEVVSGSGQVSVVHPGVESLVGCSCRTPRGNVGLLHVEGGGVRGGVPGHAGHVGAGRTGVGGEAGGVSVDIIGFSFTSARGEEVSELSFITSAREEN